MAKATLELGQMCFGCAGESEAIENEDDVCTMLRALSIMVGGEDDIGASYGEDYSNDTFTMRRHYWGDCDCGAEGDDECKPTCATKLPNFACGDYRVTWYKYIGRGMAANRQISREELRAMFARCMESI